MTREKLRSLEIRSLHEIADKHGVEVSYDENRESIIDKLFEAFEEDRLEREADNNLAIRVEETKYIVSQDEELDQLESDDFTIPDYYNDTRIVLLLRDPSWAFAYWDIRDTDLEEKKKKSGYNGLLLRVHECSTDGKGSLVSFDIPVQPNDNRWYINLPQQEMRYYVELVADGISDKNILAASNCICAPRNYVRLKKDKNKFDFTDKLIAFSWSDTPPVSSDGTGAPQRIISFKDEQYLQMR